MTGLKVGPWPGNNSPFAQRAADEEYRKAFANLHTFGDSLMAGSLATISANKVAQRVQSVVGGTLQEWSVGGTQVTDMASQLPLRGIRPTKDDLTIWIVGYNDNRNFGDDSAKRAALGEGVKGLAVYMALPNKKYNNESTDWTRNGSWTYQDAATYRDAYFSNTVGNWAETEVEGETIYVGFWNRPSGRAVVEIRVDGVLVGTYDTNQSYADEGGQFDIVNGVFRRRGLTPGKHVVRCTVPSGGGVCQPWWAAGHSLGDDTAQVWLMGCPRMPTGGYAAAGNPNFNNGTDAAADLIADEVKAVVEKLQEDGLDVRYIAPPPFVDAEDWDADLVHWDDSGHMGAASAFITEWRQGRYNWQE